MSKVHEEAAAWVARLEGPAPAAEERARFDAWIAISPAHAAAYDEALRTWHDLAAMRGTEQYRALLGKPTLRERIVNGVPGPRWFAAAAGVAAVAAFAWLAVSLGLLPFPPQPTQVATAMAEVRETTLPDGTRVVLGAQSQLSFEVTANVRRATVVGGDAYFTVAHDSARPFTVSIDDVQVRVVGTQFEIRRRSGEVSVAVEEGTVDVARTNAAVRESGPQRVLALCAEHERRWPHGIFEQEREGTRAIAWCNAKSTGADARARAFLASYPRAAIAARVREECAPQPTPHRDTSLTPDRGD